MSDSIEGLKQRLVGAFVILTLAIIFLPMIFDKPHEGERGKVVPIPPKPDFQSVTITKPEKPRYEVLEVEDHGASSAPQPTQRKPVAVQEAPTEASASAPVEQVEKTVVEANSKEPDAERNQQDSAEVKHLPVFKDVWMVQLGTFSNKENAYRLRDRMRKDGFDSHTKPLERNGKTSIRVFAGPFVSKLEAQKFKTRLDAKYRVQSLVLHFDP